MSWIIFIVNDTNNAFAEKWAGVNWLYELKARLGCNKQMNSKGRKRISWEESIQTDKL